MITSLPKRIVPLLLFLFLFMHSFSQLPYKIVDGRSDEKNENFQVLVGSMPKEVLFGLQINNNGDVYFAMNNLEWFNKLFSDNFYGVTVDLVSKDRYACGKQSEDWDGSLPKGTLLFPAFKPALTKGINAMSEGTVFVKIGTVPIGLRNKQLESNLVLLHGNSICYYTNFVNIDRSVWQLLPMGLFTDSLIQDSKVDLNGTVDFYTYTKRIQIEVPFEKGSTNFNEAYLKKLTDSINLNKYSIRKIQVRAYSSVEGPELLNKQLMNRRADTILSVIKKYQEVLPRTDVITAENWLDFFNDMPGSKYEYLQKLSKTTIKQKLTDKILLTEMEPLLSKERKAVIILYVEEKSTETSIKDSSILLAFAKSVADKDVNKARAIQKELVNRIMDNKLPVDYINKLEVPKSKDYSPLLNDREVYKYLLKVTSESEALENFRELRKFDPTSGRINYNICALEFYAWQYGGDTVVSKTLLHAISELPSMGIDTSLTKRMQINYYILTCEDDMKIYDYDGKDTALDKIKSIYTGLVLNDDEIYSLAKYFAAYSHDDWALEIISTRIDKIDVSEDLAFYYVNLLFYTPGNYGTDVFRDAALNAINLNNERFCNFFIPNDKGGASMQLLDYEEIRELYCSACSAKNFNK